MAFLKKLHGLRSAIMAVVLLGEVLAKGFGYESGPVFSVVHTVFAAIGWSGTEPVFDPAAAGAAILTLYAVVQRVRAYLKGRGAGAEG